MRWCMIALGVRKIRRRVEFVPPTKAEKEILALWGWFLDEVKKDNSPNAKAWRIDAVINRMMKKARVAQL